MHRYRERAEDLRGAALSVSHADNKKILLAAADRYEQLAHSDEQARTDARSDKVLQLQNDLNRQNDAPVIGGETKTVAGLLRAVDEITKRR